MGLMPPSTPSVRAIVTSGAHRSEQIVGALHGLNAQALLQRSSLPDWTRLTIACHLRYGAEALLRMTHAAISGERAAYYPGGRVSQRPLTLEPLVGESPEQVVESLRCLSGELDQLWNALDDGVWEREVTEPDDNPDLGRIRLFDLSLLRLTEVEVHGSDLGLGLDNWSDAFVGAALPARLTRLSVRRTNHRAFDHTLQGSWLLIAVDGPTFVVSVSGDVVDSHPAEHESTATAVIEATSRDLLALLLGRPVTEAPHIRGDVEFGRAFQAAFPGP